jgi:hypothetical protein
MCYSLYLSTNSNQDLKKYNDSQISFKKIDKEDEIVQLLKNENKWFVGSSSGCSCTFRYLSDDSLEFGEPEDWMPEEKEEIEATLKLYEVIYKLIADGYSVECINTWEDIKSSDIKTLELEIDKISAKEFRLFENHLFKFKKNNNSF